MEHLTELLCDDRAHHRSKYSVVIVSEGAMFEGGEMVFSDRTTDAFGHLKLGGIGDLVSAELKSRSAKYNKGKPIDTINQRLGYMVRGGDPDAIDSIVPMAYGNLALDLILHGSHGRLVVLKNGRYDNMPIESVTSTKKTVNVERYYNKERLRPLYTEFEMQTLFIMASDKTAPKVCDSDGCPISRICSGPDARLISMAGRKTRHPQRKPRAQSLPAREGENIQTGGNKVGVRSGGQKSTNTRAARRFGGMRSDAR